MNPKLSQKYDVLVIGGGCAALSAAITARENDASVLILEKDGTEKYASRKQQTYPQHEVGSRNKSSSLYWRIS